jgi:hypothetical protein
MNQMLLLVFFSTLSSIGKLHSSFENTPNALAFNNRLDILNPFSPSTLYNKHNASNTLDASTFHNGCGVLNYYVNKFSNGPLVFLKMSLVIVSCTDTTLCGSLNF